MRTGLPKRLNYQDAAFANFERDNMPLNVGSVGVYEGTIPYQAYLEHVDRRIDQIPRYRQRLIEAPFSLAFPEWVDDPRFDITRHVRSVTLPPPGSKQQLADVAAAFFAEPLSRQKPLWEILLVHGLANHRTAHVAKVHHCMVDGVSGVGLLAALLDLEPKPAAQRRRGRREPAPPLPGPQRRLSDAFFDAWGELIKANGEFALAVLEPRASIATLQRIVRGFGIAGKYLAEPAPVTPWSRRLTSPTRLAWQSIPFDEVHDVARKLDGTVNDVVLAALAGGLGRHLEDQGEETAGRVLRIACPVNVRAEAESADLGNRVSFMLVGAPVGERDSLARFHAIHLESAHAKEAGQPSGVDALMRIVGRLPAVSHAALSRTLSMPNTISNLICTNVPGPLVPLYCMGHHMVEHYPWVPLGWRMGLSVAVMSYDRALWFGIVADEKTPGDIDRLAQHLGDCFGELRDAAGVLPRQYQRTGAEAAAPRREIPAPVAAAGAPAPRAAGGGGRARRRVAASGRRG